MQREAAHWRAQGLVWRSPAAQGGSCRHGAERGGDGELGERGLAVGEVGVGGDGAALAAVDATRLQAAAVPGENGVDERAAHGAAEPAVVGEPRAELEGQREHPLAQRHAGREDVLDEIRGGGVPYVAVPTRPGQSYHGYPYQGRLSASIRNALETRARSDGSLTTYCKWLKKYCQC